MCDWILQLSWVNVGDWLGIGCLHRVSWWPSCTALSTKKWVSSFARRTRLFSPYHTDSALSSGAVRDPEKVEALEAREEHRGGVPPHLQQHAQLEDWQSVEPRPPAASSPRHRQNLCPGLHPGGEAHACGWMPQRHGPRQGGRPVRLPAAQGNHQQLHPRGGHQPYGQDAVLRGSDRERGEPPVRGAGNKNVMKKVGGPWAPIWLWHTALGGCEELGW